MFDPVSQVLRGLRSKNPRRQKRAYDRIWHIKITPKNGVRLIQAAAETFPNDGIVAGSYRINRDLIQFLWREPHDAFVAATERVYDQLVDKAEAREQALRLLTELGSEASLKALVKLLKRPSSDTVNLEFTFVPVVGDVDWSPNQAPSPAGTVMFPELFHLVDHPQHADKIYRVIEKYAKARLIQLSNYPDFLQRCVARSQTAITRIETASQQQRTDLPEPTDLAENNALGAAMETVAELQAIAGLLPLFESPDADEVLKRLLEIDLPDLQAQAVAGLLARGEEIDSTVIQSVMQRPDLLATVWDSLRAIGRLDAFPKSYRNQPVLAEADLVKWLAFPTEMGFPPAQVELLTVYQRDDADEGKQDFYFFKFRHSEFQEGKWFVGMAGPYRSDTEPEMHGSMTFSRFGELEKWGIDGHIRYYFEDMEDDGPLDFVLPVG